MGTFSRLRYVVAANVNALLEKAEDPQKMLRALIREMEEAREEARIATSELMADQKHAETAQKNALQDISEWQRRAELAVSDDRDDLAREALKQKAAASERADAAGSEASEAAARLNQIEQDFVTLNKKLQQAKTLLKELSPAKAGNGKATSREALKPSRTDRKLNRAFGRFGQLEAQVESLEARVRSYEVLPAAVDVWAELEAPVDEAVQAELESIKQRLGKSDEAAASQTA